MQCIAGVGAQISVTPMLSHARTHRLTYNDLYSEASNCCNEVAAINKVKKHRGGCKSMMHARESNYRVFLSHSAAHVINFSKDTFVLLSIIKYLDNILNCSNKIKIE